MTLIADNITALRLPKMLLRSQFADQCVIAGLMTDAEALSWVRTGELPPLGVAALALVPLQDRPRAERRFAGAQQIGRLDAFVDGPLKIVAGYTDEQLDAFFDAGAQL